ncbi:MazG nucleotide pyrophosphohydrolase domain-containing protein [Chitinibacter tainanensis]|uniref:MazG nucleotide pyrophosphohydrolase domain-containing protein n=1 Tax=Chitinibacter tainanensis TaxID=230667 RepID=UPI0004257069|nr:MazG nucleotide pyrophosphohydrolase domain-containing protein [Chitinibacter tainanensis]
MNSFITDAVRTESRLEGLPATNEELLIAALTLFSAGAELLDAIKKNIYYGKPVKSGDLAIKLNDAWGHLMYAEKVIDGEEHGIDREGQIERKAKINIDPRVFHAMIGIATEAGELADAVLGVVERKQSLDVVNVAEEIGDIDWYKAIFHDATGLSEEQIRTTVINKLKQRYPDRFTSEAAIERNLQAERATLEAGIHETAKQA